MIAVVTFKRSKFSFCGCVVIECRVYLRFSVYTLKPDADLLFHFVHMFFAGAKDNIFSIFLFHVFFKHNIQTICLFQCAAQLFKQFPVFRNKPLIRQCLDPFL